MAKKRMLLIVRGREHAWEVVFYANHRQARTMCKDGLQVYEVVNTVPRAVARLGLATPWCFLQDIFNFKNPIRRGDR